MASGARLYTPEILGLATSLASHPFDARMPFNGHARSTSCGSTLELSLALGPDGRIAAAGTRAHACAIGQASAAVFLQGVVGRTRTEVQAAHDTLLAWLSGEGGPPDWPGFGPLLPAQPYPARHGAIMLAWKAALAALPPDGNDR